MCAATWRQAVRIALNYLPIAFGGVFGLAFIELVAGVSSASAVVTLLVAPFVLLVWWMRRCRVEISRGGIVTVVNPLNAYRVPVADVVAIRTHSLLFGRDCCPQVVIRSGRRIALVAATGRTLTIDEWWAMVSPR